jgi:hypothetical protein
MYTLPAKAQLCNEVDSPAAREPEYGGIEELAVLTEWLHKQQQDKKRKKTFNITRV